ncbi:Oidioi.mRNA.OKI2018_I69.chr2.g6655.t1.cds [Oikopleura dioica]|uniref:Oidioi.mRNA.OKI2018_I69.chr2.g6655.t1.cds n=1 Tax=Oikopleura dioica TaxID=34765 RepID=A0ABN7T7J3_OIKDI|nr:Oidioi.mRNA.OKI2018_I69.chr2.g6655.t1.cds [Oikopleura dioica]
MSRISAVSSLYVTSYGQRGQCSNCFRAFEFTAIVKERRLCKSCAENFHGRQNNWHEIKQRTDATFKCAATPQRPSEVEGCGAENLTYREYMTGSCCDNAARRLQADFENLMSEDDRYQIFKILEKYYDDDKEDLDDSIHNLNAAKEESRKAKEEKDKVCRKINNKEKIKERILARLDGIEKELENDKKDLESKENLFNAAKMNEEFNDNLTKEKRNSLKRLAKPLNFLSAKVFKFDQDDNDTKGEASKAADVKTEYFEA